MNTKTEFRTMHELARKLADGEGQPYVVMESRHSLAVVAWEEFTPESQPEGRITWIAWPENWPLRAGE